MKTVLLNTAAAAALVFGLSAAHAQNAPASGGAGMDTPAASGSASGSSPGVGAGSAPAATPGGGDAGPGDAGIGARTGAGADAGVSAECPPGAANCSGGAAASDSASTGGRSGPDAAPDARRAEGENPKDGTKSDQRAADQQDGKQGDMKDGRAAAQKELSSEQRTVIRERVVSRADRVNVNFNVSVGTVIPQSVHVSVQPLPSEIIEIYPSYRGYSYIVLSDGRVVIIEPSSYEIVTIISV